MVRGILCIDKPQGFTSFDVVAKMRGITRIRRIGHAGTLDPMATGVLPIFFGNATRAADILPCQDKEYIATFRLGTTTKTEDITGEVTGTNAVSAKKSDVLSMINWFTGEIEQIPPMYSAVQIGGKRLYDLARKGIEVERTSRRVTIYENELTNFDEEKNEYTIRVKCSKGTYIRTLCADIGKELGCGAVLTALRRTMAAGFTLYDCITIEEAQERMNSGNLSFMHVETAFLSMPKVRLSPAQTIRFSNGGAIDIHRIRRPEESICRVLNSEDGFIGIGEIVGDEMRIKKLFTGGDEE